LKNNNRHEMFESAPIPKVYFALTLPSVIGKLVLALYNMADTWYIAMLDDPAMVAGVALCGPINMLVLAMADLFGLGGNSVIARLFGKGEYREAKRISAFCFYGAMFGGALMALIFLMFREPILLLLGADASTMEYASVYYTIFVIGTPLTTAYIVPQNFLRAEGLSRESMIATSVGSVANIILDPIFIFLFDMGIAGAALATVLSHVISLAMFIWYVLRKANNLSLNIRDCETSWKKVSGVFANGVPSSINNMMQSVGAAMCNRFLLQYGSTAIAAAGIATKVSSISSMLIVGFTYSAGPLIGYNYGKGNRKRLKDCIKFFYSFQMGQALLVALVIGIFAPQLVRFYMEDPTIVQLGTQALRFQMTGRMFMASVMVSTCICQAVGKAKASLTLSLVRQGVIYIGALFIGNTLFGYNGVVAAQPAAEFVTSIIAAALVFFSLSKEMKNMDTRVV